MKMVNPITSLRPGCLINHNLENLVDVLVQFSPYLSPPSLFNNDSALRDATDDAPIDYSLSQPNDLVDSEETKKDESKKGDDISQPLTIE